MECELAKLRIQGHVYGAVGLDFRIRAQLGEAAEAKLVSVWKSTVRAQRKA